ncbi:hypothetical protein HJG60_007973 [Phyllostomus discolor]|uniref:Uncharacterized protein n=1 Tax=Phyllostomus discolor TaxID=89673 RepID=A0A834BIQ6_9CHIR|nr:hypothetical protein HJG60_007973 [Phyllostomus discolor]
MRLWSSVKSCCGVILSPLVSRWPTSLRALSEQPLSAQGETRRETTCGACMEVPVIRVLSPRVGLVVKFLCCEESYTLIPCLLTSRPLGQMAVRNLGLAVAITSDFLSALLCSLFAFSLVLTLMWRVGGVLGRNNV